MEYNTTEYVAAHQYVRKIRGVPEQCLKCGTQTLLEWANCTGQYSNPYDYIALCRSCHRTFDRKSHCKKGHIMPDRGICVECKRIVRRAYYHRNKKNPVWYAHLRVLNREAQRRYYYAERR